MTSVTDRNLVPEAEWHGQKAISAVAHNGVELLVGVTARTNLDQLVGGA